MKTEVLRFRCTTAMKDAIQAQSSTEGLTLTALVEKAVVAYMASEEFKSQPYKYSEITLRLSELGYDAKEIITITDWWNYREHSHWLMTASRAEIDEASKPAFEVF